MLEAGEIVIGPVENLAGPDDISIWPTAPGPVKKNPNVGGRECMPVSSKRQNIRKTWLLKVERFLTRWRQ